MTRSAIRTAAAVLIALLSWACAVAAPVPSALSIQATITLDTSNSLDPVGSATQGGTLRQTLGGVPATSSFTDLPASIAPASLDGQLTETFDGIGASLSMSGAFENGLAQTDGLFVDYLFMLSNSSATETFTITFVVQANNVVTADGADAFAYSQFVVLDSGNNEIYANDQRVDTLNSGNNVNFISASDSFVFILSPGGSASFSAFQSQRGGVFAEGTYSADMTGFIALADVRSSGGNPDPDPNGVPLPGSLPLALAAFAALVLARVRRGD